MYISSNSIFAAVVCVSCLGSTQAFSRFAAEIPNVGNVRHFGVTWTTLGHPQQGGATNVASANNFGADVLAADATDGDLWPKICELDSDGDGVANKIELCDPGCTWLPGDNDPTDCREDDIIGNEAGQPTHPGFADGERADGVNPSIVHGALMIFAWLVLAPIGILVATFLKKTQVKKWFVIHRALLLGAVFFSTISYFYMLNEYGYTSQSLHSRIGLAVVAMSILQPINGFLRPHVDQGEKVSSKRLIWEAGHQWFGRIIMFLAVMSSITGIELGFIDEQSGYIVAAIFAVVTFVSIVYVLGYRDTNKEDYEVNEQLRWSSQL